MSKTIEEAGALLQAKCHAASLKAGWWSNPVLGDLRLLMRKPLTAYERLLSGALVAKKLVLIHGEVSEGMEGHRKGLMDAHLPHRPMLEVELADAVIRIFDLAGALQYDLGKAISEKLAYNAQRPDHKPTVRDAEGGKAY